MDFYLFDDQAEAVKYAKALGNSSLYAAAGAPALPRCDHPKWSRRSIPPGRNRIARERCRSRTQVYAACPHVTWAHADVTQAASGRGARVRRRRAGHAGLARRPARGLRSEAMRIVFAGREDPGGVSAGLAACLAPYASPLRPGRVDLLCSRTRGRSPRSFPLQRKIFTPRRGPWRGAPRPWCRRSGRSGSSPSRRARRSRRSCRRSSSCARGRWPRRSPRPPGPR